MGIIIGGHFGGWPDDPQEEKSMDMRGMLEEFEKVERELEARRARRAPDANRCTKVMIAPLHYRWWEAGRTKRGAKVWFCVSNYVNVAGYFLIWKEVRSTTRGKRYGPPVRSMWAAKKDPSAAVRLVKKRVEAFKKKRKAEDEKAIPKPFALD
jgi:hypothetical protein